MLQALLPTSNRPEYAAMVVQGLMYQTAMPDVLTIVDQSDTSAMAYPIFRKMVSECSRHHFPVDYRHVVQEEHLAALRKSLIRVVSGDLLYLVDDDVSLPPTALQKVASAMKHLSVGLVANAEFDIDYENIRMPEDGGPDQLWVNRLEYLRRTRPYTEMQWPQGSNLLVTREAFEYGVTRIPDADFDHAEDLFFCYHVKKKFGAYHVADPIVRHFSAGKRTNVVVEERAHWDLIQFLDRHGYEELLNYQEWAHPTFWLSGVQNGEHCNSDEGQSVSVSNGTGVFVGPPSYQC